MSFHFRSVLTVSLVLLLEKGLITDIEENTFPLVPDLFPPTSRPHNLISLRFFSGKGLSAPSYSEAPALIRTALCIDDVVYIAPFFSLSLHLFSLSLSPSQAINFSFPIPFLAKQANYQQPLSHYRSTAGGLHLAHLTHYTPTRTCWVCSSPWADYCCRSTMPRSHTPGRKIC